jgi:predicted signal transduction protein with EAL and GGDEF domain
VFPDDAGDAEALVERADAAQGRAKRRGRGAAVRPAA